LLKKKKIESVRKKVGAENAKEEFRDGDSGMFGHNFVSGR
jgi:hypothetical protein